MDEQNAASALAVLATVEKRNPSEPSSEGDKDVGRVWAESRQDIARLDGHHSSYASIAGSFSAHVVTASSHHYGPVRQSAASVTSAPQAEAARNKGSPRPYPFFFYKDFSGVPDPDPLTPLTGKPIGSIFQMLCSPNVFSKACKYSMDLTAYHC
jgi:hypothetical protein